jgi:hypothetical protein
MNLAHIMSALRAYVLHRDLAPIECRRYGPCFTPAEPKEVQKPILGLYYARCFSTRTKTPGLQKTSMNSRANPVPITPGTDLIISRPQCAKLE